ncbi:MAG: hypothetical protein K6E38_07480 [Fretibacterium sp.]|nr:hypothetical protein [Fretibacterium sp.]
MKKICGVLLLVLFLTSVPLAAGGAQRRLENPPKADLDLTELNSMMAYTGLFNIFTDPEAYVGKMIRLRGQFDCVKDEETGEQLCGVILTDAAACCAVGLDFVLKSDYEYPRDYPRIGEEITVMGRFELYRVGEDVFARLTDSDIL